MAYMSCYFAIGEDYKDTIWCDVVPWDILLGRPWICMGCGTIHICLFIIEKSSHYTSFKVGPTSERFEG